MRKILTFVKREEANPDGGDGGGSEKSWRDELPEDIRDNKALADYKDVSGMAKSLIEAQRMIGSSVRIPSEDAGEEDWNKFYTGLEQKVPALMRKPDSTDEAAVNQILTAIGKPENKGDYETTVDLDGFTVNPERLDSLKTMAAEAGLTKAQFNKMAGSLLLGDKVLSENSATDLNDSRTSLRTEWGEAFDNRNAQAIAALKKTNAPQGLIEQVETGKVGGETLKWAYALATSIGSEGVNVAGQDGGSNGAMSPDEAQEKIQDIVNNKAYWDSGHPNYRGLQAKMQNLQRVAHPKVE